MPGSRRYRVFNKCPFSKQRADAQSACRRCAARGLFGVAPICSIRHWQVILPDHASGGSLFFLYILWWIPLPGPASGGPLFVSTKRGEKATKGAAAPLETPLVRDGRCGCLVSVCTAYRKISVPKFPLTQRRTPPPACLLRVTNRGADSAPARAPSTLVRWHIEHVDVVAKRPAATKGWMRFRTHINGAHAGALLAPQMVTRRSVAGGDVQLLQSLQFRDYSLKHTIAP